MKYLKFTQEQFETRLTEINSIIIPDPNGFYIESYCRPTIIGEDYYMPILESFEHLFSEEEMASAQELPEQNYDNQDSIITLA